ncbi:MAG: 2Fe-2S iron-sulfur cluster-binding protein [Candidatus Poribacteria bacterium]|nr:2Fe-2S iron-sulfur cluster-binding protein [Candidatus Poribacteria bacterium]
MGVLLQISGLIIAAALFLLVVSVLATSLSQHRGTVKLMNQQMEDARAIAEAHRLEYERARTEADLSWQGYRKFEIQRKAYEDELQQICSFYLVPHDKRQLPPFKPGQFLTFQLQIQTQHDQPGQPKPTIRCYSLSECSNPDLYRVSIKRMPPPRDNPDAPPGLASNYFHDHLNEGDIVDVKAPGGNFFLDTTQERPVVLIGGGIGVTPVLSMLNEIVESGSKRETWFFYGARNGSEHVMKEHLNRIALENDNVHLHVCYSAPKEGEVEGEDYHHKGRVSVDLFKELLPSNNYQFHICGPPPMMTSLVEGLEAWDVPDEDIKFEAFGPASVKKAPPASAIASAPTAELQITFGKSGKTCAWDASAGSILDFAEANGVVIDAGCRVGNCNTCLTAIKSGEVDYVRPPDTPPDAGTCLTCISVPKGDLTLDA